MLKNYFKTALRNLYKYKITSVINISGLSVGIACFILISAFFYNEVTYDTFHVDAKNIYRIYSIEKTPQGFEKISRTPDPLASALRNDYPASNAVSISHGIEFPVSTEGRTFKENIYIADPSFFSFFTFPFMSGNSKTALNNPSSVVITEDLAAKFYGKENALGKTILIFNKYPVMVSGILKKIPSNSSIQLSIVVSTDFVKYFFPGYQDQWTSSGRYTFVKCSDKFTTVELKNILPKIREKYLPDFLKVNYKWDFNFQSLTTVHLHPEISGGIVQPVSKLYLYLLVAVALSIITIASINFMNISVSHSLDRAKEISVRRILGSKKSQLLYHFLTESVLLSFIALLIGTALAEIILPKFNLLTGKEISLLKITIPGFIGLISLGLFIGVFSGLYPAILLSSSSSIEIYKSKLIPGGKINFFRKMLMTAQFTVSIVLISCILIIAHQINYMKNFNLGFQKENILVIPLNDGSGSIEPKAGTYVNEINQSKMSAGIINVSVSEHTPGYYYSNEFGVIPEGSNKNESITMVVTSIDENFLDTYKLPLVEGRNFSPEYASDSSQAVLINQTAMEKVGWKSAVGKSISFAHGDGPYRVIGVVKDMHFKSLQNKIEPLVIRYPFEGFWRNFLSIRINSANIPHAINYLKEQWQKIIPERQFEYFFVDDLYNEAYKTEERTAEITGSFSIIAIILACLGLLGLTILTSTQRIKEIGIRKAIGASIWDIISLISKQFIVIILIADIIAFPTAYLLMSKWLMDFPYRINLNVFPFLLSGFIVLIISLLTISYQTIKAAIANPVDSLRYE